MLYMRENEVGSQAHQDAGILMDAFEIHSDPVRCNAALKVIKQQAAQFGTVGHYLAIRMADHASG